jgi:hypothetical protein
MLPSLAPTHTCPRTCSRAPIAFAEPGVDSEGRRREVEEREREREVELRWVLLAVPGASETCIVARLPTTPPPPSLSLSLSLSLFVSRIVMVASVDPTQREEREGRWSREEIRPGPTTRRAKGEPRAGGAALRLTLSLSLSLSLSLPPPPPLLLSLSLSLSLSLVLLLELSV